MKKGMKIFLIVIASLILVGGALAAGWFLGEKRVQTVSTFQTSDTITTDNKPFNYPGMMRNHITRGDDGRMGNRDGLGYGGMMGGSQGVRPGIMQGYFTENLTPLSIDQATQAAQTYLDALDLTDMKIAEVMIFDNGAYVRVSEESTGIGAFELLVDPVTSTATPERGPNKMWNLKYGSLNHACRMDPNGGLLAQWDGTIPDVSAEMTVSSDQAIQKAQAYLDTFYVPGTMIAGTADPFYGYYTIDILKDGILYGMLSVNGSTGQVFYHAWHGNFIEQNEGE